MRSRLPVSYDRNRRARGRTSERGCRQISLLGKCAEVEHRAFLSRDTPDIHPDVQYGCESRIVLIGRVHGGCASDVTHRHCWADVGAVATSTEGRFDER